MKKSFLRGTCDSRKYTMIQIGSQMYKKQVQRGTLFELHRVQIED